MIDKPQTISADEWWHAGQAAPLTVYSIGERHWPLSDKTS